MGWFECTFAIESFLWFIFQLIKRKGKSENRKVFVQLPFHCAPSTKSGQFLAPLMCAILFKTLHVVL